MLNFETVITPTESDLPIQFGSRCEAKKTASCHTCFVEPRKEITVLPQMSNWIFIKIFSINRISCIYLPVSSYNKQGLDSFVREMLVNMALL